MWHKSSKPEKVSHPKMVYNKMLHDLKIQSFMNPGKKVMWQLLCAILCVTIAVTSYWRNEVVQTFPRRDPEWLRSLKSVLTHVFNSTLISLLIEFIESSHWPLLSIKLNWKLPMVLLKSTTSKHPWFFREPMTLTITGCLKPLASSQRISEISCFSGLFSLN